MTVRISFIIWVVLDRIGGTAPKIICNSNARSYNSIFGSKCNNTITITECEKDTQCLTEAIRVAFLANQVAALTIHMHWVKHKYMLRKIGRANLSADLSFACWEQMKKLRCGY
mmetsp:Transcript_15728/g.23150  ORF Transcript_15728/g.23150 Transcript_15728/m.23150 type:complete len:113 (-) Transcript_15728:154-492(-)